MKISDKIKLSIGEADFLFKDNTPLVSVEEQTVFPIDRLPKGFLLEVDMPSGYKADGTFAGKVFKKGDKFWLGKKRLNMSRENHPNWKGGRNKSRGYILILKPNHPFANNLGYVREHRLIVEAQIGRYLLPKKKCHHLNEIKNDNRPENLMAFVSNSAHMRFERGGKVKPKHIIFDGRKLNRQI